MPGADPPGTHKPCFQIRVDVAGLAGEPELDFLDAAGNTLLHVVNAPAGFRQIPLYAKPNRMLPALAVCGSALAKAKQLFPCACTSSHRPASARFRNCPV